MSEIEEWEIITKKQYLKKEDKGREEFISRYGEKSLVKKNAYYGRLFCAICGNETDKVVLGEICVIDEAYNYKVQICPDCIEKLYNLLKGANNK